MMGQVNGLTRPGADRQIRRLNMRDAFRTLLVVVLASALLGGCKSKPEEPIVEAEPEPTPVVEPAEPRAAAAAKSGRSEQPGESIHRATPWPHVLLRVRPIAAFRTRSQGAGDACRLLARFPQP